MTTPLLSRPQIRSQFGILSRYETLFVALISSILIGFSSHTLGIWELGESAHADLLNWMWSHETWLQVNIPQTATEARSVPELAMGWWPSLISYIGLSNWISPELALRLPFVMIGALCAGVMYSLTLAWRNSRSIALTATALLLITPTFALGGRHMLATGGLGGWFCMLATLALLNTELKIQRGEQGRGWQVLGLGAWVFSAGSLGIIGLIVPLMIWGGAITQRKKQQKAQELATTHISDAPSRLSIGMSITGVLIIIGLFYWRSWVKRASGVDAWSLYVSIDPLTEIYHYEKWKGFQNLLHLIGFGLFPLGAFLPVISQSLKTADQNQLHQEHASPEISVGNLMTLNLIICFFSVALLAPVGGYWGGGATLLCAPFALGVASFMHDGLKKNTLPLYLLAVMLLWILIDSDLKRDPGLLLSTLSGADPKGLLPELSHWRWARFLTLGALGWMILYHTSIIRDALNKLGVWLSKPTQVPTHFHLGLIITSILGGLGCLLPQVSSLIPRWVVANSFTIAPFWGHASITSRLVVLTLLGLCGTYWLAHLMWRFMAYTRLNLAARQQALLESATALSLLIVTPHYLGRLPIWRFMRGLISWMETDQGTPRYLHILLVHFWVILILWALLFIIEGILVRLKLINIKSSVRIISELSETENHEETTHIQSLPAQCGNWVKQKMAWLLSPQIGRVTLSVWLAGALLFHQFSLPSALSAQLSHHDLIKRYQDFTTENPELKLYLVRNEQRGYYLKELKELTQAQFQSEAQQEARAFFMIERDQLSKANRHFREATKKHLPILDDQHHKLLLASNQILVGEEDRNPIKRAVIKELPQGVQKPSEPINFEDQIELIGWKLTPNAPRPGTPVKLEMFWKAKRKVRSDWKVFVHIDAPGQRIHGDHDPVSGVYPMQDWQVDDLIVDEHHINLSRTINPATFTFYAGLYRGKTRMKIKNTNTALKDKENRAKIGQVRVR